MLADFAAIVREARKRAEAEARKPNPRRLSLRCELNEGGAVRFSVIVRR